MRFSRSICLSAMLLLTFACGKKNDSDNSGPTEPDRETLLQESKAKWESMKANNNTYTYRVTFLEDTGKRDEEAYVTVVGVQDGEVACRSYWHSSGDSYIEGKADLNSHKDKGATARSIDDLYRICSEGLSLHKSTFYLHYGTDGILLGCNNKCNNDCDIDEIPFSAPKFGVADCSKPIKF